MILIRLRNDDEARGLFNEAWLGDLGYDINRLKIDEGYARFSATKEWLKGRGWDPDQIFAPELRSRKD